MTGERIRRVGFREGTDAELTALHSIEMAVEAERRPDRAPQPLHSYMAFARSLPSQFSDHTWVVEEDDGAPVATGACWTNAAGDQSVMECDIWVLREWRRRGIGARLMRTFGEACIAEGQTSMLWASFDTVPAGAAFSERIGGRIARAARTSELGMDAVDWALVDRWIQPDAPGYSIEWVDGSMPPDRRADAATFHHIMNTQPHDDLDLGDVLITADDVAEHDRAEQTSVLLRTE